MSDTGATSETRAASAPARRRALSIALWALMFAMAGSSKVFGDRAMVEMFAAIGIG